METTVASTLRTPREKPASTTRRSSTQRVRVQAARVTVATGATVQQAATGGEDYELLACVPPARRAAVEEAVAVTWVGAVTAGPPGLELRGAGHAGRRGYEHPV